MDTFSLMKDSVFHAENEEPVSSLNWFGQVLLLMNTSFVREYSVLAQSWFFAESDAQAIGVAASKIPSDQYRSGLESGVKAGHSLSHEDYPYELGYVSVSPDHGKRGIGRKLVDIVLEPAEGKGVFATTSNPAMKDELSVIE